jgi:hypothetical protein
MSGCRPMVQREARADQGEPSPTPAATVPTRPGLHAGRTRNQPTSWAAPAKSCWDARGASTLRGEPLDPVAGHISCAEPPVQPKTWVDGRFKLAEQLRAELSFTAAATRPRWCTSKWQRGQRQPNPLRKGWPCHLAVRRQLE